MKTTFYTISNDLLKKLLDEASVKGLEVDVYEGILVDNYIIHSSNVLMIKGVSSEYIVIREAYRTPNSSKHVLYLVDSEEVLDQHIKEINGDFEESEEDVLTSRNLWSVDTQSDKSSWKFDTFNEAFSFYQDTSSCGEIASFPKFIG